MYYITILEFAFETQFVDYAEVCLMDTQEYSVSTVLSSFSHCELPNLTDYSVLNKVDSEEFFFDPPLKLHEHLQSGPFILISSPGAVGKQHSQSTLPTNTMGYTGILPLNVSVERPLLVRLLTQ